MMNEAVDALTSNADFAHVYVFRTNLTKLRVRKTVTSVSQSYLAFRMKSYYYKRNDFIPFNSQQLCKGELT